MLWPLLSVKEDEDDDDKEVGNERLTASGWLILLKKCLSFLFSLKCISIRWIMFYLSVYGSDRHMLRPVCAVMPCRGNRTATGGGLKCRKALLQTKQNTHTGSNIESKAESGWTVQKIKVEVCLTVDEDTGCQHLQSKI